MNRKNNRPPLIGVTSDFNAKRPDVGGTEPTCFVRSRYFDAIYAHGGIPVALGLTGRKGMIAPLLSRLDGVLFTGSGPDLSPSLYGEKKKYAFAEIAPLRVSFEMLLFKAALAQEMPILGICGGTQLINVASKGSLLQDISCQVDTAISHRQKEKSGKMSHSVRLVPGTRLYEIIGKKVFKINSHHHQAVKKTGRGIEINAVSPDGVIEGIEIPGQNFAIGVQWHPEIIFQKDPISRKLFRAFIEAARKARV
ncbi:MAG TPA: gamma-glutamyl-gamma-aminobutyrate hydrolase family protein [Nitrospiria bacterium]|nr:gamma-glutamyl-gamma-aminobutyrate hydrolase family protein [Nitrospiria bacterium]